MSIKKCVNGSFVNDVYREYGTDTDTITTLPKTIIGDGQNISAYTIKGNMSQSGTPTPSNPIYPQECGDKTANLLPLKNGTYTNNGVTITITGNNTISFGGQATGSGGRTIKLTDVITLPAGEYRYKQYGGSATAYIQRNSDNTIYYGALHLSEATEVYLGVNVTNGTDYTGETMTVMLNEGTSDKSYEPFGYKIPISSNGVTYPIYLPEPIRKIGDSVDTAPSTGTVTRTIYKWVFDGTENWTLYGTGSNRYFALSAPYACVGQSRDYLLTTHFEENRTVIFVTNGTILRIYDTSDWVDETAFKTWLSTQYAAGTPVTVWYVLATATTESFTAPTLPTSGTAQTFDVDTSLKPSEVSLTYHGWHEHSDTKFTSP